MAKEIDFRKLVEMREPLSNKDEYMHDLDQVLGYFPRYHNESWYFNFIDRPNKVHFITRFSVHMDTKMARILCLLIIDNKKNTYFNEIPLTEVPTNWEIDKKIKYFCIEPMKEWRVHYEDRNINLDINIEGRFPEVNFGDVEDLDHILKTYGEEFLKVAAQEHYEQPTMVIGKLELKKKIDKKYQVYETRQINALGHRDHSWGIRKWIGIDSWNWVSAQFEDMTINFAKSNLMGKTPQIGFIHLKNKETEVIEKIEVSTITKEDGKTPVSSTFTLTTTAGNEILLNSETFFSVYLTFPSRSGITEIFEQMVIFTCEGKEGDGISEYMISTRN